MAGVQYGLQRRASLNRTPPWRRVEWVGPSTSHSKAQTASAGAKHSQASHSSSPQDQWTSLRVQITVPEVRLKEVTILVIDDFGARGIQRNTSRRGRVKRIIKAGAMVQCSSHIGGGCLKTGCLRSILWRKDCIRAWAALQVLTEGADTITCRLRGRLRLEGKSARRRPGKGQPDECRKVLWKKILPALRSRARPLPMWAGLSGDSRCEPDLISS